MGLFDRKKEEVKTEALPKFDVMMSKIVTDIPKVVEDKKGDWVLNGPYNSFPLDLIDWKNNSAIHSAIIESATRITVGTGIQFDEDKEKSDEILASLDPVTMEKVKFLMESINPNDTLNSVMYDVVRDWKTFGYCYIKVTWNKDYSAPIIMEHVDASRMTIGKKNDMDQITHFYYSKDWRNTNVVKPIKYGAFNPLKKEKEQIIFINNKKMGGDYYGLPYYIGASKWIKCDSVMASINLNSIENGFSPNVLVRYFSDPNDSKKEKIANDFERGLKGVGNKILYLFWPNKENAPEVTPINVENFNERMVALNDMTVQQIISAHRIPPMLAGIQTAGKLGGASELEQSYKIYFETVIRPERVIFENILTKIFKMNGVDLSVYFSTPDIIIEESDSPVQLEIKNKK